MDSSRFGLLVIAVMALAGCGVGRQDTSGCCAHYEKPSFDLTLFPLSSNGAPIITITEDSAGALMYAWGDDVKHSIGHTKEYKRLKREVLGSKIWKAKSSESFYQGPWGGPPIDHLIVQSGKAGLSLCGESVPKTWKDHILRLAAKCQKNAPREQNAIGKSTSN